MIADLFNAIIFGFKLFYTACLWIGWANTTIILGILKGIVWLFTNSTLALRILCEDFLLFLEDVGEAVEWVVGGSVESVGAAVEGIWGIGCWVLCSSTDIPSAVRNSIMSFKLGTYLVNFIVLVKDAVLFLGICFWEIFALIYAALVFLNEAPYIVVLLLARVVENTIYNLLFTVETYWFRSICGFTLAYGCYFLAKKAGLLPERKFQSFIFSGIKRCHYGILRAIQILRCSSSVLFFLKSAALTMVTFIRRQSHIVKTACWQLYREFLSYTPTKAAIKIKLEKEKASSQCVVCMDRRRDVVILSCRHLLMCKQCALTVAVGSGECPVCRTPIDNIISVYT